MYQPEFVKICGLSTKTSIDAVIDGGASHMGLIFFEKSPRNVSLDVARELSEHAGNRILKTAVSVNANDELLDAIVDAMRPDLLQLHGQESRERVQYLKNRFGLPVMKVFPVYNATDLEKAEPFVGVAEIIMFDAKAPDADLPGGNGVSFDWKIMDLWPTTVPYVLSGGLGLDNVANALQQTGAYGIDLSSGVESEPGIKNPEMIKKLLQIVR